MNINFLRLFICLNSLFLGLDIIYAHGINSFHNFAEYIPLFVAWPGFILFCFPQKKTPQIILSLLFIIVGVLGLWFHLEAQYFQQHTLKSLVYTAPFMAPLSFSGIGFLMFIDATVPMNSRHWYGYVFLLGHAGFIGNFVLALCDHSQNGMYYTTEWIPVFSAAILLGFLPNVLISKSKKVFRYCEYVIFLQVFVGILGTFLHLYGFIKMWNGDITLWQNILDAPPLMAPLLYVNLSALLYLSIITKHKIDYKN